MPRSASIQLVCFDIGGVLARCVGGWAEACHRAGIEVTDELLQPHQRKQLIDASHRFEVGELDAAGFGQVICGCSKYDATHVQSVLEHWIVEMYPGIDELLSRLIDRGVTTALLSNTNALHWAQLEGDPRYAPLRRVEHRFASHLIRARKPDAAAYEHVERTLKVDSENILFFDDREENIAAAVWAHWQTKQIDPAGDTAEQIEKQLKKYGLI